LCFKGRLPALGRVKHDPHRLRAGDPGTRIEGFGRKKPGAASVVAGGKTIIDPQASCSMFPSRRFSRAAKRPVQDRLRPEPGFRFEGAGKRTYRPPGCGHQPATGPSAGSFSRPVPDNHLSAWLSPDFPAMPVQLPVKSAAAGEGRRFGPAHEFTRRNRSESFGMPQCSSAAQPGDRAQHCHQAAWQAFS
jgi:hypothetical protein